jgi:hypothetical protein
VSARARHILTSVAVQRQPGWGIRRPGDRTRRSTWAMAHAALRSPSLSME